MRIQINRSPAVILIVSIKQSYLSFSEQFTDISRFVQAAYMIAYIPLSKLKDIEVIIRYFEVFFLDIKGNRWSNKNCKIRIRNI